MATITVYSASGKKEETKEFSELPLHNNKLSGLLWEGIVNYNANQRQGTASTKGRSEVNKSRRKPWPQKGRGTARAGSAASPIWRGGGVTFGPKPRSYSYKLPKNKKKRIYQSLWLYKVANNMLSVIDTFKLDKPSTKGLIKILNNMGYADKKLLIITKEADKNVYYSARNLPNVKVLPLNNLNIFDLAKYDNVLITKELLPVIEGVLK